MSLAMYRIAGTQLSLAGQGQVVVPATPGGGAGCPVSAVSGVAGRMSSCVVPFVSELRRGLACW